MLKLIYFDKEGNPREKRQKEESSSMTNNDLIETIETYKQATAIRIWSSNTEAHYYLGVQYLGLII